jgi:hypothetical protein
MSAHTAAKVIVCLSIAAAFHAYALGKIYR